MTSKKLKKDLSSGSASPSCATEKVSNSAHFSQKELRKLSFEISARWFNREPAPGLTLSVVHPWRIHAYWCVGASLMKAALKATKAPHALVLRFTDLTPAQAGNSAEAASFDVEVDGLNNNWYIDLWQPGRHYVAELGLRGADDTLHSFARSNKILVPRAEPSPVLEFKLAQYQRAKPVFEVRKPGKPAYSVAHLTGLLPPFSSFPNVPAEAISQSVNEPEFPRALVKPVQNEEDVAKVESAIKCETTPSCERFHYGTDFPQVTVEPRRGLAVDYTGVPELPEIDPFTISPGSDVFKPMPQEFSVTPNSKDQNRTNPSAQSATPLSAGGTSTQKHEVNSKNADFPQIDSDQLAAYHRQGEKLQASLTRESLSEVVLSESNPPDSSEPGDKSEHSQVQEGVAPKPVVALEETLAESFFSGINDKRRLNVSVQVELSGTSDADQILTLFGEPVDVDEQGRFSVQIKLDRGPGLAALVRAQRHNFRESN